MYTCLTIGYGDVAPMVFRERALMIVFLVMGVIGIAYVVGNFANFFEDKLYTETEREKVWKKIDYIAKKIRKTIDPEKRDDL